MPPPTNISAATATVLTMPALVSQDTTGATAPLHEVWFTYGPATGADVLVGWYAAANPASHYQVRTDLLAGSPSSLAAFGGFSSGLSAPVQFTIPAGTTLYFRVYNGGTTEPLGANLQLSLTRAPNSATPAGVIAVNDDAPGFPLVLISPVDGTVLSARPLPFPSGETGAVLPNGVSIWHDYNVDPAVIRLYDASLTLRATASWTFAGTGPPLASNRSNRFYLGDPGATFPTTTHARVTTMDATGVMGPTIWTFPEVGLTHIAPSHDDTVLYYRGQASGAGAIQRWNLVANTALPDFAANPSGYLTRALLVLADGTLVAAYSKATTADDSYLRQYSASGTLVHQWPLGALEVTRLAYALDDPASVWTWSFVTATTGLSRFQNIRLSDGVVLTTLDNVRYEGGSYRPATPAPPPPAPAFGHSPSCPFLLLPVPLPPYSPPDGGSPGGGPPGGGGGDIPPPYGSPGYALDARLIRRLRRAPHLSQENVRVFYRKFELDLERGVGVPSGLGDDPLVMLRLSRDGGHTWSEPVTMSAGRLGAYTQRVIARRLGHGRDLVFEVTVSDPVAWSLVDAWLDLEAGTS